MHSFINRGVELQLIEDACDNLRKSEPFLHTSIIDFYGVEGIGKTSMLEKAVDVCRRNKVRWIKADASQTIAKMSQEIIEQARKYTTQLSNADKES
jgi:replication-associated recombination protein RarA